jgi:hypothetical protein
MNRSQAILHNLNVWAARLGTDKDVLGAPCKQYTPSEYNGLVAAVGLNREPDPRIGPLYAQCVRWLGTKVRAEFHKRAKVIAIQHYAGASYGISETGLSVSERCAFGNLIAILEEIREDRKSA